MPVGEARPTDDVQPGHTPRPTDGVQPAHEFRPPHEIEPLRAGEVDAFFAADAYAFSQRMPAGFRQLVEHQVVPERVLTSRDGGEIVGAAASDPSVLTLPGLSRAPVAIVVSVSVRPTHRRQGRLRALMRAQLDDLHQRGEPLATLFASEGAIYRRFGYGVATFGARFVLDRRAARLSIARPSTATSQVRLVERPEAAEVFGPVYAGYAPTRAGEVDRSEIAFATALGVPGDDDLKNRFYAVHHDGRRVDGYVAYSVARPAPDAAWPSRRVEVEELCALTAPAYAGLWDFLLGIDLVDEVRAGRRPVDEPLRWLLEDPRQLRTAGIDDRTWLRLIDVRGALVARRYPVAGTLVITLHDGFCPWNEGTFRLHVSEEWAVGELERAPGNTPDLELGVSELSSLYLGGVRASELADAGRVVGAAGSIALADRLLANDRPPFCLTSF